MWKIFMSKADFLKSGGTNELYNLTAINRGSYDTFEFTECFNPEATVSAEAYHVPDAEASDAAYDMYLEGRFVINGIHYPSTPK